MAVSILEFMLIANRAEVLGLLLFPSFIVLIFDKFYDHLDLPEPMTKCIGN